MNNLLLKNTELLVWKIYPSGCPSSDFLLNFGIFVYVHANSLWHMHRCTGCLCLFLPLKWDWTVCYKATEIHLQTCFFLLSAFAQMCCLRFPRLCLEAAMVSNGERKSPSVTGQGHRCPVTSQGHLLTTILSCPHGPAECLGDGFRTSGALLISHRWCTCWNLLESVTGHIIWVI